MEIDKQSTKDATDSFVQVSAGNCLKGACASLSSLTVTSGTVFPNLSTKSTSSQPPDTVAAERLEQRSGAISAFEGHSEWFFNCENGSASSDSGLSHRYAVWILDLVS